MRNNEKIGNKIKDIRLGRNETMEQFAKHLESDKSNVSRWERGINIPNEKTLRRIADLADVPVNELLHGNEPYLLIDDIKLYMLKPVTFNKIEEYESETSYIFDCRISLEITDRLSTRDYIELDYITQVVIYIYVNKDSSATSRYLFGGFEAILDTHYEKTFSKKTLLKIKETLINNTLRTDKLSQFKLTFDDLVELT